METNLLPCPFCGGEAKLRQYPFCDIIKCEAVDCFIGPSISMSHDNADHRKLKELIKAWNTRHERTCHVEGSYYDELMDESYTDLSCGHHLRGAAWEFDFCSRCGTKVVGE